MESFPQSRPPGLRRALGRCSSVLAALIVGALIFPPAIFASQATLAWDPSPDPTVSSYRLYYGNASRDYPTVVEVGDRTTWTVPDLIENLPYFFAVTACDRYGNESDYSEEVSLTVYEDAEDLSTAGWDFGLGDAGGGEIRNVFDEDLQRRVIELSGFSLDNCYRLRRNDFTDWNNSSRPTFAWRMRSTDSFVIVLKLATTVGDLALRYTPDNKGPLLNDVRIRIGLGPETRDGTWRSFVRNLQADLESVLPGARLLQVRRLLVQGSCRLTDVKLLSTPP